MVCKVVFAVESSSVICVYFLICFSIYRVKDSRWYLGGEENIHACCVDGCFRLTGSSGLNSLEGVFFAVLY